MFRWKGILLLIALFGLFIILSIIFTDIWLESELESLGNSIVSAKVEIDNLDLSFTDLSISWDRLQVTNPKSTMKNMLETGNCEFDMEFLPLLSKKVIIESFAITGVRTNTDRETDGKLSKEEKSKKPGFIEKTVKKLQSEVSSSVGFQIASYQKKVNVDSIMKLLQIQSITKMDTLKNNLEKAYAHWETRLAEINLDDDVKKIESKIKALKVDNIKTVDQAQSALKDVNDIKTNIDSLTKFIKQIQSGLFTDLDNAKNNLNLIDNWIAEDYARARSLAKLPDINAQNIAELIFGKNLVDKVTHYLGYVAQARSYANKFQSDKPEKETPPRLKGQNIYFYNKNARPDLWIKKINLSGETENKISLVGDIKNIVSDQRLIGSPTQIDIGGKSAAGISLALNGLLNYLEEVPAENFKLTYDGFSLADTYLSHSKLLPNKVQKGKGHVESVLNLAGETIQGNIKFVGSNLTFQYAEVKPANKFEELIQQIVHDISEVDVIAKINGKGDDLKFSINSNIDDLLVAKTKAIATKEIEQAKDKIKQQIETQVKSQRANIENLVQQKENILKSEMKKYEEMINQQVKLADDKKKEIDQKIGQEKSKLKDKLKDIIKF